MKSPLKLTLLAALFVVHANAQKIPFINAGEVLSRAAVLQDSGRYEDAIKELVTIPSRDTAYVISQSRLAKLYLYTKQFNQAITTAEGVMKRKSVFRAEMIDVRASGYEGLEQFDKAKSTAITGLTEYPFSPGLLYDLARAQQNSDDYTAATKTYFEVLARAPFTYNVHLNLATIALLTGRKTHAMMSLAMYIALMPSDNERLRLLESAASNQVDNEGSESKTKVSGNAFERLDQILKSKIAMEKNFKTEVPVDAATVRQFEMIFKQLNTVSTSVNNDPWMKFYLPVYTAIRDQNLIEPFIYHVLSSSNLENVQKWNQKNEKKREAFFKVVNEVLMSHRETIAVPSSFGLGATAHAEYFDNHKVYGVGMKSNGKKNGKWFYFFENSERSAEGLYKDDKKSGEWKYFNEDGTPSTNENTDTGEITEWYPHGQKSARYFVKNNLLEGELNFWHPCGNIKEKRMYVNGKRNGKGQVFYESGMVKMDFEYADDNKVNTWTEYYESGKVKSKSSYKAGLQEGIEEIFWQNGKLKTRQNFVADKLHGPAEGYNENGTLESKGENINGVPQGEWLYYNSKGEMFERRFFDSKGIQEGEFTYFYNGKPASISKVEGSKIFQTTYFDPNGKDISKSGSPDGNFAAKDYFETGQLFAEGSYKNGKHDGKWTNYYIEGSVRSTINYVDGKIQGEMKEFFRNGKVKSISYYEAGEETGYAESFYPNGQVNIQGTSAAGRAEQQWVTHYPDGTLNTDQYFINGVLADTSYYYGVDGKLRQRSYSEDGQTVNEVSIDPFQKSYFMDVKLNGEQVLKYASGSTMAKYTLACGQLNGKIERFFPDGKTYYNCGYANNEYNGEYIEYDESGTPVVHGRYESGLREGVWTYTNDLGKTEQIARYGNGSADSLVTDYYLFGPVRKRSEYMKDELHGIVRFYGSDGTPVVEKLYNRGSFYAVRFTEKNGQFGSWKPFSSKLSVVAYYPNGNKAYEEHYENGTISGPRRMYFPDGKVAEDFNYNNGDAEGSFTEYYPSGKVCRRGQYRLGSLEGLVELFDENGLPVKSIAYKMGKKHGITSVYSKGKKLKEVDYNHGFPIK